MPAFSTILHDLQSPANVGMIVRTHVAMGGSELVFVGLDVPWRFRKNTQAFSRKLEKLCAITYLDDDDALFAWCAGRSYAPVALEIADDAIPLLHATFPERCALIVGHEGRGLSADVLARCEATVVIPQFGPVACLNAAVSMSIAMYDVTRQWTTEREIRGNTFWVEPGDRVPAR